MALCAYVAGEPIGETPDDLENPPCATCGGNPFAHQHVSDESASSEIHAGDLGSLEELH